MFQTKVVEKIKTHILCSVTFFRKSCRLWDNVGKYGTAKRATDDNTTDTHFILDNQGHKHKLRIRKTYFFSTATKVSRTPLNITLCVYCLSCLFFLRGMIFSGSNITWMNSRHHWYDMIYLLTAVCLPPAVSSSVHIYTQTIHRTTQNKQYTEQHKNLGRRLAVPHLYGCYPGICLTTEGKARKNLSQGSRRDT
jgi:hypothetical protein